ncbi:unnamed protein product [Didymodactylos carnosus]|uniref:Uncharacterized protein n=1 Tax=Didymodactylos carnosus TaxID=1234261 RepID=A0A8S2ICQ0_9BILA|nr:unnamed protein product [Didymodactylos carnosus]CAF3743379.1 unnamed protein product [Didymodactylos carnosus]
MNLRHRQLPPHFYLNLSRNGSDGLHNKRQQQQQRQNIHHLNQPMLTSIKNIITFMVSRYMRGTRNDAHIGSSSHPITRNQFLFLQQYGVSDQMKAFYCHYHPSC